MKKETRIFLIILIGWLALLDFAILKTISEKYDNDYHAIVVKNLVSGAAIYYPSNSESMFQAVIVPMIIFNILIIIFLGLGYYFWEKSRLDIKINKKSLSRKAQAAMEFMMTYGWAIMALAVSLAALSYFGVINLSPTGNSICALSPGFTCEEFIVGKGGVLMVIRNGMGIDLNTITVNITNSPQGPCNESTPPKDLVDGAKDNFFVPCYNINSLSEKFKGDIIIKYRKSGSQLSSTATGIIKSMVTNYSYNDTDAPSINLIEPINGQAYSSLLFNLRYNVNDYNPITCYYTLDDGGSTVLNNCQSVFNISSINAGQHNIKLYAYDTKNNTNMETASFTTDVSQLDAEAPKWGNPGIEPHTVYRYAIVSTRVDWTENTNLLKYGLYIKTNTNPWAYYANYYFSGQSNSSIFYINATPSVGSTIFWKHEAYDIYGNYNISDEFSFIIELDQCQINCEGGGGGDEPINPY